MRIVKKRYETTAGRLILREIVPTEIAFDEYNRVLDKRALADLMDLCYRNAGNKRTVVLADRLRTLGFEDPSSEQRREQLARNVAMRDWPKT